VKLLFDENPSSRLVLLLDDLFPASQHVRDCGLRSAGDAEIWEYAKNNGLIIVTKDSDFEERSVLLGTPPKVIWLRIRNSTTGEIASLLRAASRRISRFNGIEQETCLILEQRPTQT
jgi:predicted nuclease of predicted toxin-antitoxin system